MYGAKRLRAGDDIDETDRAFHFDVSANAANNGRAKRLRHQPQQQAIPPLGSIPNGTIGSGRYTPSPASSSSPMPLSLSLAPVANGVSNSGFYPAAQIDPGGARIEELDSEEEDDIASMDSAADGDGMGSSTGGGTGGGGGTLVATTGARGRAALSRHLFNMLERIELNSLQWSGGGSGRITTNATLFVDNKILALARRLCSSRASSGGGGSVSAQGGFRGSYTDDSGSVIQFRICEPPPPSKSDSPLQTHAGLKIQLEAEPDAISVPATRPPLQLEWHGARGGGGGAGGGGDRSMGGMDGVEVEEIDTSSSRVRQPWERALQQKRRSSCMTDAALESEEKRLRPAAPAAPATTPTAATGRR
jgi:hypothetical protein